MNRYDERPMTEAESRLILPLIERAHSLEASAQECRNLARLALNVIAGPDFMVDPTAGTVYSPVDPSPDIEAGG